METRHDNKTQIDARRVAGLLSEEKRLKVVAALVLGARNMADVCERAGLDSRAAAKAMSQLTGGGLVEADGDSGYRLKTELFRQVAKGESGSEDRLLAGVARDGRLPRSREERLAVLGRLAELFETERRYAEADVNARLGRIHPDYAFLRRSLIDEGLMERANEVIESGGTVVVYWRTQKRER